eukprot:8998815-Pyramimonas_sp.AAC.1
MRPDALKARKEQCSQQALHNFGYLGRQLLTSVAVWARRRPLVKQWKYPTLAPNCWPSAAS